MDDNKVDELARRIEAAMSYPDVVNVHVKTRWMGNLCLPDSDGEAEETAVFRTLTYGDNFVMERACRFQVEGTEEGEPPHYEADVNEIRRLIVKRNLVSWTLDIPIVRENGWMTEGSYAKVGSLPAPLMEAFISGFEERTMVTKDEESEIVRQSTVLFSPNSPGITDACEAVSLFCTLGNYFEKFGLDKDKLWELPYREYVLLKMMVSQEGESHRRESAKNASPTSNTRIVAGQGGRSRPSQGVVVRDR